MHNELTHVGHFGAIACADMACSRNLLGNGHQVRQILVAGCGSEKQNNKKVNALRWTRWFCFFDRDATCIIPPPGPRTTAYPESLTLSAGVVNWMMMLSSPGTGREISFSVGSIDWTMLK